MDSHNHLGQRSTLPERKRSALVLIEADEGLMTQRPDKGRRSVIKILSVYGALIGAGVFMPRVVMAAWSEKAFAAKDQTTAMKELLGGLPEESAEVTLKVPGVTTNASIVPVTVRTGLEKVESISIFVDKNPVPLVAEFIIPAGTDADVSMRLRMGKASTVTAVVKADGKLYSASKQVKLTTGGCGG